MKGKLSILCLLAAAVVLTTAATSSAAELTYPTGTRLATGTTLKGVNVGEIKFTTPTGTLLWGCSSASMTGTLVKNNGTEVEANIETASFTGTATESKCTSAETTGNKKITAAIEKGLPWCLRATTAMKEDEFQIRGGKCSEESRQIRIGIDDALGECRYKREAAIVGTFTTEPNDAIVTATSPEFVKEAGSVACTTAYKIDFSFTLERDEEGTHPVYLSAPPPPPPPAPELTYPTGTRLTTGSTLKGTNVGVLKITDSKESVFWECTSASTTGSLVKNNGSEVEANIETLTFSGTGGEGVCTPNTRVTTAVEQGLPWCLKATAAMKEDEFQIRGGKCSEASRPIRIVIDTSMFGECRYKREAAIAGSFSTEPNDAVLTISGSEIVKEEGQIACPTSTKLDFSLTLERDEAGTKPVYIS